MKNEMGKTRDVNNPYEIYRTNGWEWRVLKKYQSPENEEKNPYARWFCAVKTEYTFGSYDMGDTYISDIYGGRSPGVKIDFDVETLEKW